MMIGTRILAAAVAASALFACFPATTALASGPTLKTITIDGDLSDWTPVRVNPLNTTLDGEGTGIDCARSSDLDCPVQSKGRDLREFAWTHDDIYLYVLVRRQGSDSNTQSFWFYLDRDDNGFMETGEPVLRVIFKGSSGDTSTDVYPYEAVAAGGDPMTDAEGRADGHDMPGNAGPSIYHEDAPDGGDENGLTFEARIPWSVLGVGPGAAMGFHVSSSNSANPNNLGSQLDDNLGRLDGGVGELSFAQGLLQPDSDAMAAPGEPAVHAHSLTHLGPTDSSYDLTARGTLGLEATFLHDIDGDGVGDVLMGVDATSDGAFDGTGDSIEAGWDRDGDGILDTPILSRDEVFYFVLELRSDVMAETREDVTILTATPANPDRGPSSSVVDRTHVGAVAVRFDAERAALEGQDARHPVQVCNLATAGTFDVTGISASGFPLVLWSDDDGDGTGERIMARDTDGDGAWDEVLEGDSDGNGVPDTGALGTGECRSFVLSVGVPAGTAIGTRDSVRFEARASSGAQGVAILGTTASREVEITPTYRRVDGTELHTGNARSVFFPHVVRNNSAVSTAMRLDALNNLAWTTRIWSDPNGDGSLADGEQIDRTSVLAANGGEEHFVLEVIVPARVEPGTVFATTLTAIAVADASLRASVVDEGVVSLIATYSDPLFSFATSFFAPCDVIYVQGRGLEPGSDRYSLSYSDPTAREVRFVAAFVADDDGVSLDEYTLGAGDRTGSWSIILRQDGVVVSQADIEVEGAGIIQSLTVSDEVHPFAGASLEVATTLANENVGAALRTTTLEHVVRSPSGTRYLDGPSLTWLDYTGSEITRSIEIASVPAESTFDDLFTLSPVDFEEEGLHRVDARWITPCGTIFDAASTALTVGSALEDCTNGLDDDGDGLIDCDDPECALDPACRETDCTNGLDDDGDGVTDCDDSDCALDPACREDCDNGIDDDGDGAIDCADRDCTGVPACTESECSNGLDDDGDTLIDCSDPDCDLAPECNPEDICDDLIDNDSDGAIDCDDTDCVGAPECGDSDFDDDGVPNSEDCAPFDPGAHHVPTEPTNLTVVGTGIATPEVARLRWSDPRMQAGTATVSDVISGRISELWIDRGIDRAECLSVGRAPPTMQDDRLTGTSSDGWYYLVRARNVCGASGWGTDSSGDERRNIACVR